MCLPGWCRAPVSLLPAPPLPAAAPLLPSPHTGEFGSTFSSTTCLFLAASLFHAVVPHFLVLCFLVCHFICLFLPACSPLLCCVPCLQDFHYSSGMPIELSTCSALLYRLFPYHCSACSQCLPLLAWCLTCRDIDMPGPLPASQTGLTCSLLASPSDRPGPGGGWMDGEDGTGFWFFLLTSKPS